MAPPAAYSSQYATYVSDCSSADAIGSPLIGLDVGMEVAGHFDVVPADFSAAYDGDSVHGPRGGLKKTVANGGALRCRNANRLVSMAAGAVSVRMSLPYDMADGVYAPTSGKKNIELTDFVIFGVNMGGAYITQPGVYAALTPYGIEFCVWSSAERKTIWAKGLDVPADTDFVLDFVWDSSGLLGFYEKNMVVFANGQIIAEARADIRDDSLEDLYGDGQNAEFWMLDTPTGSSDMTATLRRVETYSSVPGRDRPEESYSSSSSSPSSQSAPRRLEYKGVAEFKFDLIASDGPAVLMPPIDLHRVCVAPVDMRSIGPIGSSRHIRGSDLGGQDAQSPAPPPQDDLPPGFEESREPQ